MANEDNAEENSTMLAHVIERAPRIYVEARIYVGGRPRTIYCEVDKKRAIEIARDESALAEYGVRHSGYVVIGTGWVYGSFVVDGVASYMLVFKAG